MSPSLEAPPADITVPSDIAASVAFLYSGDDPVQVGLEEEALDPRRTVVLNGRVVDRNGAALEGVQVSVVDHPEFGHTLTREDGEFDLVANGGSTLEVLFQKSDYLPVHRHVTTGWREFVRVDDVVLIPLDPQATEIDFNEPMQVARGSLVSDEAGARQATLLFPEGARATMLVETESGYEEVPLETFHVRATEYTVGPSGPSAMPAELPPASGYTYAVEVSVDEALSAGATRVELAEPVVLYLENYLGFPTGTAVPLGSYDATRGAWVPEDDGVVVEVLAEEGGVAVLDVDGSGLPADRQALDDLEVTDAELARVADLYEPGASLWRVMIDHFTPWDCNWPYGPPPGARGHDAGRPYHPRDENDPCKKKGSIIECRNQVLGQALSVPGTPFLLRYQSDRVPGRKSAYTIRIPLSGEEVPPDLQRIDLEVEVAGQTARGSFEPVPDQAYTFVWNGLDRYGREVQGLQTAEVTIGYAYPLQYYASQEAFTRSFATYPDEQVVGSRGDQTVSIEKTYHDQVGTPFQAQGVGLGGWTLNVHHLYQPDSQSLYLGDGTRERPEDSFGMVARTVAGMGWPGTWGDGGAADEAALLLPAGLATDGAGNLYIADPQAGTVRKVDPDGVITRVAGNPDAPVGQDDRSRYGEGVPATEAWLDQPLAVAVDRRGNLYIADTGHGTIRKVDTEGTIRTVAGLPHLDGTPCETCVDPCVLPDGSPRRDCEADQGAGLLAVSVSLDSPVSVAVGTDGSFVFTEAGTALLHRVDVNGFLTTIAGSEQGTGSTEDGIPATSAALSEPWGVAIDQAGAVYVADRADHRVRRIGTDGIIRTVAGTGEFGSGGDGGPATEATLDSPSYLAIDNRGTLYIGDDGTQTVRKVDPAGKILPVAGDPDYVYPLRPGPNAPVTSCDADGASAGATCIGYLGGIAVGADGTLFYADQTGYKVREVVSPFPGFGLDDALIPSQDGAFVYHFDPNGRHLETLDALTGDLVFSFEYDDNGLLTAITDREGRTTTIERDQDGTPLAIVSPYQQTTRFVLDENGYLAQVIDPSGRTYRFTYSEGLMTSMTDPNGNTYTYTYDEDGRLIQDTDPVGGGTTLTRTELDEDTTEVALTTAEGVTTIYRTERGPGEQERRQVITLPTGALEEVVQEDADTRSFLASDGTTAEFQLGPDPRWGMAVPYVSTRSIQTPNGLQNDLIQILEAYLSDPDNPMSLRALVGRVETNGRPVQMTFDATTRTYEFSSAEGRSHQVTFDENGRVSEVSVDPAILPTSYTYDTHGRYAEIRQGAAAWAFTYDSRGLLSSQTDAAGRTIIFDHDDSGFLVQTTLPSGRTYQFTYDANGNRTGVIMPNGAVHTMTYTPVNLEASYQPPTEDPHQTFYNLDRQMVRLLLPSGETVDRTYDAAGRLVATDYDGGTILQEYQDGTGRVHRLVRLEDQEETCALTFHYDGHLVTGLDFDTLRHDAFSYQYDENFFLVGMQLSGQPWISLVRDRDGLLVTYGPFSIDRDGPAGVPSAITGQGMTLSYFYDDMGRLDGTSLQLDGQPDTAYELLLDWDVTGRTVSRTEQIAGETVTRYYTYDDDGQLLEVSDGTTVLEAYTYDENGNRTSRMLPDGTTEVAEYDAADRITARGDVPYTYDQDGFMTGRGGDTFTYTRMGELIRVDLADGRAISYTYDGLGRRVTRTSDEGTTTYLYGNLGKPAQITAVVAPSGEVTYYYYDEADRLFAFQKGETWYFVGTDQVSSPRVVVDAGGNVVKRIERDAFGAVLWDSNPDLLLDIGFAGGLFDPDTGLIRFGFRDYDPEAGRWTARDPLRFAGAQANLFVYVGNNPVVLRDPLGLVCIGGSLFMGLGGGGKLCIDGSGVSVCGEVGVGLGQSVNFDPFGGTDKTHAYASTEASVVAGVITLGVSSKVTVDPCGWKGDVTAFGQLGVGPLSVTMSRSLVTGDTTVSAGLSSGPVSVGAKYGKDGLDLSLNLASDWGGEGKGKLSQKVETRTKLGKLGWSAEAKASVGGCYKF